MWDFLGDKDIINADVEHSWFVKIMNLPTFDLRCNALDIFAWWVTDEMRHLFGDFKEADSVVQSTAPFMLEYPAIEWVNRHNRNCAYPLLPDADSAFFVYSLTYGAPSRDDGEKARVFLRLMADGYMRPDVDRIVSVAGDYVSGERYDVSMRG